MAGPSDRGRPAGTAGTARLRAVQSDVRDILIDRGRIARRVEQMALEIADDLAAESPVDPAEPQFEITLVPILTGSIIFVADLIRHLPVRMQIHMASVSSYPGSATTSRGPMLRGGLDTLPESLAGRHVLVIDDILDSGRTLKLVTELLQQRRPASLRSCVLLRKPKPGAPVLRADYVGFDIPDEFVVGYGLDFNDYYRNLPDIVTLRPEALARPSNDRRTD